MKYLLKLRIPIIIAIIYLVFNKQINGIIGIVKKPIDNATNNVVAGQLGITPENLTRYQNICKIIYNETQKSWYQNTNEDSVVNSLNSLRNYEDIRDCDVVYKDLYNSDLSTAMTEIFDIKDYYTKQKLKGFVKIYLNL
jgi:hypothetical protein